ncbi:putative ribonucleotide reductase of class Ia (aerobic) beta subunit [Aeromonas phage LAh_9]|uniref:ribonucleoside-diphosphate reductase n=3 Tax=Lahexavirus TaxID=2843411 RepID=A0A514A0T7_9CAUD|nr:ribonucleotide reductase [Aeromonas phage 4_4572]YP_009847434.1 ribonucleotide reductase [Aeromonas phage LAh_8]YP_009847607.1 ribonucleotide reductase [Aeromonas phage LAh_9]QDH46735.1 putative ribonucleotide reductase of class Ia (aerobic) beta subunit [Aeromonas phage LAh_8]QDH46881.1 putative ribonucleotide reductase of class Ia (aerobic) beta subunit [Aeromonas phage LAh_9]QEG09052.1 hypothetical protein [Aeromonas phage 4_4572]
MAEITKLYEQLPVFQKPKGWVIKYPEFAKLADEQMHSFWPWDEPVVDNDIQDLRTKLTPAELNGITTVLKLFTLYEMHVGEDYWTGRIGRIFHRPEITRMAALFSAVESNSHAPFYNKLNEVLYMDTEEFYSEWEHVKELRDRIHFIEDCAKNEDHGLSIASFSFIEGSVLYSNFAYIKHFQSQECGKDMIRNVCRGVDLSVADENTHSVGGAMLYNKIASEMKQVFNIDLREVHRESIVNMAHTVYNHEEKIIDLIFEQDIQGITKYQMTEFVKHRINLCLKQLGYDEIFNVEDTSIEKWFYQSINSVKFHDFFTGNGSEYNIQWDRSGFGKVWGEVNV